MDGKGIALITVLWIMVILEMVAASLIYITRLQVRLSAYRLQELQTLALANAGVERGAAEIYARKQLESEIKTTPEKYPFTDRGVLGGGEYSYTVENEEGKINLNTGSREQFLALARLTGAAGGSQLADYILAQRKEGKKFISLEELDGQPFWTAANRDLLEKRLTVFSTGKLNVNGLDPELIFPQLGRETWDKIRAYHDGGDMLPGTADDLFIDEVKLAQLMGEGTFKLLQDSVCYRGQSFLIRAKAVLDRKVTMIKRWVRFDETQGRLIDLCWQES